MKSVETDVPPLSNVDDGNAENISGGWSPVEPSPVPEESSICCNTTSVSSKQTFSSYLTGF